MSSRAVQIFVVLCLVSFTAFAQSADQAIIVTDSPDPIVPGNNLTYSITVTNNGPDPAVNGGFNAILGGGLTYQSTIAPAGFTCFVGFGISCTSPSFAAGQTANFTLVAQVNASLLNFPDGTITSNFTTSGVTTDPNSANNSVNVVTSYDSPQIDMTIAVTDSPDPVTPDNNITYTVTVGNTGPDAAIEAHMNTFNNGSLQFQSVTAPPGWSCVPPAVGSAPTFTCTNPSFAPGTAVFTVVARASLAVIGPSDGTLQTNFGANATGNDTNHSNESETEDTAYVTPDADMTVSVTDSPDPVTPNNDITYTVTVGNTGPDTAPNARLNLFNSGTLRFQSVTAPAGFTCGAPAVGAAPTFTCTNPSFPSGSSVVFTIVVRADPAILGINDGTVSTSFSAGSDITDPDNSDNSETESTGYVTPDADMTVAVTDSPDPVTPNNDITYTVTVTNAGPDTAPNAKLNLFNNGSLRFQSVTPPAGWSCAAPAVGSTPTFQCTNASFASGGSSVFTIVVRADSAILGINDGTVSTSFSAGSDAADPVSANSSETEDTAYVTPDADLNVTNSDTPDPVVTGATITYTQVLTNQGPDTAPNATLSETLPSSVGFQSIAAPAGFSCTTPAVGASGVITCTHASLPNGGGGTFTIVVNVIATSGIVTNTVVVGSAVQDPDNPDNSATVNTQIIGPPSADLVITKTTPSTSAAPGSNITYTITLTNNGPDAATAVSMTDTLPASLLFQSITQPAGFSCTTPAVGATGTITCSAATLANGAAATFTLVVQVASNATGSVSNSASAASATSDPNGSNSSGSSGVVALGGGGADMSVIKSTNATSAMTGSTINYTILVTNNGPATATNVVVSDTLPSGVQFVSATPTQGSCSGTSTVTCNLGSLANGASATIALTVQVTATSGTISNSATVSASESDPAGGNNGSTTTPVPVVPQAAGEDIPTLSEWALIGLVGLFAVVGISRSLSS